MIKKGFIKIFVMLIFLLASINLVVYGASISGVSDINVGENFTLTFDFGSLVGAYDDLNVLYDSSIFEYVSGDPINEAIWWDQSHASLGIRTKTYTFKALKAGSGRISVVANGVISANETIDRLNTITAEKYITSIIPKSEEEIKNEQNQQNNNNSKPNPSNPVTASGNNYLRYLQISAEGLSPNFSKYTTNYSLSVGENVNSIEILARPEDQNAVVLVTGNNNLVNGENKINIRVTAENGYYRTYTITVTKAQDFEKADAYLENLVIEGLNFSPEFQSEILEYDIGEINSDIEKINILAYSRGINAKIEIIGADVLQIGEGEIIIKITAEDGINTKEYKIKYTRIEKVIEEEEILINALESVQNSGSKKEIATSYLKYIWFAIKKNYLLVLMYVFILFEFIQILILRRKLKKSKEDGPDDLKELKPKENDKSELESNEEVIEKSEEKEISPPEITMLQEEPMQLQESIEDVIPSSRKGSLENSGFEIKNRVETESIEGIKLVDLNKNEGPKDELTFNIFDNLNEDDIKRMLEDID